MNKKDLSERDICNQSITPAILQSGWDVASQIREDVGFTKGRIIVRGKLVTRSKAKRADYILYYKPNIPIPNCWLFTKWPVASRCWCSALQFT